jgi:hypothetical protein
MGFMLFRVSMRGRILDLTDSELRIRADDTLSEMGIQDHVG